MNGYRWIKLASVCALTAGTFFAASCTTEVVGDDDDSGTGDGGNANVPQTEYVGVQGVAISQVAMYQGVKRVLAQDGVAVASSVPLVAGRDALVRVFYRAQEKAGQAIVGRLFLWNEGVRSEEPILTDLVLSATSNDGDLASTANFYIPGDLIGQSFHYSVELVEEVQEGLEDNPSAHHPAENWEEHVVEGPQNTFRVVLAPFQYNADGSGRLPNLSEAAVEAYRTRFLQLYPVSNVEITVREPTQWSGAISANGQGWQEVGIALSGYRGQDGESADPYYYAIFNPAASFGQFCIAGCLLGVTLLNDTPTDVGNPGLRLALGVGFDEVATDTAAHELGHAHGREHANCGQGLDPNSIDGDYPHAGGGIGVWGWDIVGGGLIDPGTHSDIMGYCQNQWISDYNFAAFLQRGQNVNLPRYHEGVDQSGAAAASTGEYSIAAYDGFGGTTWKTQHMAHPVGKPVQVSAMTEAGPTTVEGHFYRYDHLPGGWFVYPKRDVMVTKVEVSVDGSFVAISR